MVQKSFTRRPMRPAVLVVLVSSLALMVMFAGCSSTRRNARPSAATTTAGAQINQTSQGLTVDRRNESRKRDFSIQADVLKTATLQCASRPGQNVCLELRLGTVTGLDYAFRDTNWAAGHNEQITEVYNYLKLNFPQVTFSERAVKEID